MYIIHLYESFLYKNSLMNLIYIKIKMYFNVKIPIIVCIILILYVLIMVEYNKK